MKLIDALKIKAECENTEDLRNLSSERKKILANLIEERVPSGLAPIEEWNEAIACFATAKHEKNKNKAKSKLLSILREEEPSSVRKNKWSPKK